MESQHKETSKKEEKKIGWIWPALAVLFLAGIAWFTFARPQAGQESPNIESYELTMIDVGFDTPVTFQAQCDERTFVEYLDIVRNRFIRNNELFDQYEAYEGINNIYTINQAQAGTWIEVDPLITDCLEMAAQANTLFEHFDVSQGKLISLWHEFREGNTPLPGQQEILESINTLGMEAIEFEDGKVMKTAQDVWLDLGAIAKGFTVAQCVRELEEAGCTSGYINAGGNVALVGHKEDGEPWKVGIIKPDSDQSAVRFTTQDPTCLVTSGDYQRYVVVDGTRYSHIIDPQTGYPADYVRSVTVIDEDSAWADALSTILFLMDVEDGINFCSENKVEAVWIVEKGTSPLDPDLEEKDFDIYCTAGIREQISLIE